MLLPLKIQVWQKGDIIHSGKVIMKSRHSGLVIYAKAYKKLADFYSAMLPLNVVEQDDEFVLMASDSVELVILQAPTSITKTITMSNPPAPRENVAIKPVFFIDSIQAAREFVHDYGGFVNHPNKEWMFRGYRVCDGYDPEGNIFQLRASQ